MDKEKPNRLTKSSQEGYVIMPNNFLTEWVKSLGKGPVLLYLQLLTYCHKEKDIAWPALSTLGNHLDMSKNSLISYQKTLLKYGLIKKSAGRRSTQGNYRSNLYKITPMECAKIGPHQVQKLDMDSPKFALDQVQNLHPNSNNINSNNITTTKREDVVVDFKKIKEEGEEKMQAPYSSKEHYTGQAIKERLMNLDFERKFIEQLLKDYPLRKIEEKLDLLMERRNIQNPAGWLSAALKNDYQNSEQEGYDEEPVKRENNIIPTPTKTKTISKDNEEILSSEEARRRFHLLRHKLMAMK